MFSGEDKNQLFTAMNPDAALTIQSLDDGDEFSELSTVESVYGMDALFIPYYSGSLPG